MPPPLLYAPPLPPPPPPKNVLEKLRGPNAALDYLAMGVSVVAVSAVLWELRHPADEFVAGLWVGMNLVGVGTQLFGKEGELWLSITRGLALLGSIAVLINLFALPEAKTNATAVVRSLGALGLQGVPVLYVSWRRQAMLELMMRKRIEEHPNGGGAGGDEEKEQHHWDAEEAQALTREVQVEVDKMSRAEARDPQEEEEENFTQA